MASAIDQLESVSEDEQGSFDNLSEGLQAHRQDSHDAIIDTLDEAMGELKQVDEPDDSYDEGDIASWRLDLSRFIENAVDYLENVE